jgi:hypothetical protein
VPAKGSTSLHRLRRTDAIEPTAHGAALAGTCSRRKPRDALQSNRHTEWIAPDAIAGAQRLRATMRVFMRPDHIYLAMTMVKHSTLAAACIYAFKIVSFFVKTL